MPAASVAHNYDYRKMDGCLRSLLPHSWYKDTWESWLNTWPAQFNSSPCESSSIFLNSCPQVVQLKGQIKSKTNRTKLVTFYKSYITISLTNTPPSWLNTWSVLHLSEYLQWQIKLNYCRSQLLLQIRQLRLQMKHQVPFISTWGVLQKSSTKVDKIHSWKLFATLYLRRSKLGSFRYTPKQLCAQVKHNSVASSCTLE